MSEQSTEAQVSPAEVQQTQPAEPESVQAVGEQEQKPVTTLDLMDSIKRHLDDKFGEPISGSGMVVTHLHRTHEHWLALRQDLEHLLHMPRHVARGEGEDE
jgi:hypothetical protein